MDALATTPKESVSRRITQCGDFRIVSEMETELWVNFKVIEPIEYEDGDEEYPLTNEGYSGPHTTNINQAFAFMSGFLKWDGCCQIYFHDEPALHMDSIQMFEAFNRLMLRCREVGVEMLGEKWNGD